jgi:hypothetical protein
MALPTELHLNPDEFAFYFDTRRGIEAKELGLFLQRVATVARREGAELQIIGIREGSLQVVIKTLKAMKGEFAANPIKTTAASVALTGAAVAAISHAMSPSTGNVTPLAKAGAEIVERHHVKRIEIITKDSRITVMDELTARDIKNSAKDDHRARRHYSDDIGNLRKIVQHGAVTGYVTDIDGELHFRPDGFRFLIPINQDNSKVSKIYPGLRYSVHSDLITRNGQPDSLVIHHAFPI